MPVARLIKDHYNYLTMTYNLTCIIGCIILCVAFFATMGLFIYDPSRITTLTVIVAVAQAVGAVRLAYLRSKN